MLPFVLTIQDLIKKEIIIATGMVWPVISNKWEAPSVSSIKCLDVPTVFPGVGNNKGVSRHPRLETEPEWQYAVIHTLDVRSQGKQLVLFSWESIRTWGKTKVTGFVRNLTLSVLLYFQILTSLTSNKKITGENQNSWLGTYNNTNLILKTTEWMIYKVPSLYYLHHFPPLAAVFLLGTSWITLQIVAF